MRATPAAIENAILQVFMDLDVPDGACLSLLQLRKEWPRMQLRRTDLIEGIKQLIFAGELRVGREGENTTVCLTQMGLSRARQIPGARRGPWNRIAGQLLRTMTPPLERAPLRRHDDPVTRAQ